MKNTSRFPVAVLDPEALDDSELELVVGGRPAFDFGGDSRSFDPDKCSGGTSDSGAMGCPG